jgi:hypothetical protein
MSPIHEASKGRLEEQMQEANVSAEENGGKEGIKKTTNDDN